MLAADEFEGGHLQGISQENISPLISRELQYQIEMALFQAEVKLTIGAPHPAIILTGKPKPANS